MAKKSRPESLTNSRGQEVSVKNIRLEHLRRHDCVEDIYLKAIALQAKITATKTQLMKRIERYEQWLAKQAGTDADFENLQLTNYPGTVQILLKSQKVIDFDENLQLAKKKIDACFEKWGQDANPNLKTIVDSYFRVGEKGFINKAAIMGLFQFKITDQDWNDAMDLIRKSITIVSKKEYFQIKTRKTAKDSWEPLNLNFSSLEI